MKKSEAKREFRRALAALTDEHVMYAYEWAANGWPIGVGPQYRHYFVRDGVP